MVLYLMFWYFVVKDQSRESPPRLFNRSTCININLRTNSPVNSPTNSPVSSPTGSPTLILRKKL